MGLQAEASLVPLSTWSHSTLGVRPRRVPYVYGEGYGDYVCDDGWGSGCAV